MGRFFRAGGWAVRVGLIVLGLALLGWGLYGALNGLRKWVQPIPTLSFEGVPLTGQTSLATPTPTPFQPSGPILGQPSGDAISIPLPVDALPNLDAAVQATRSAPSPPDRIKIPAIQLDAPITGVKAALYRVQDQVIQEWQPPNQFAAGWLEESAQAGELGNLVLIGHNNIDGDVFGRLNELQPGDRVEVDAGDSAHTYQIANKMILAEKGQPLQVRMANAQWLRPTPDERLTLVTCWPKNGNSHRLILVAKALHEP